MSNSIISNEHFACIHSILRLQSCCCLKYRPNLKHHLASSLYVIFISISFTFKPLAICRLCRARHSVSSDSAVKRCACLMRFDFWAWCWLHGSGSIAEKSPIAIHCKAEPSNSLIWGLLKRNSLCSTVIYDCGARHISLPKKAHEAHCC